MTILSGFRKKTSEVLVYNRHFLLMIIESLEIFKRDRKKELLGDSFSCLCFYKPKITVFCSANPSLSFRTKFPSKPFPKSFANWFKQVFDLNLKPTAQKIVGKVSAAPRVVTLVTG